MRRIRTSKGLLVASRTCLTVGVIICLVVVVARFREIARLLKQAEEKVETRVQARCGRESAVLVYQDGEPRSHEGREPDLRILSGGANRHPENSVFYPALVAAALTTNRTTLRPAIRLNNSTDGSEITKRNLTGLLPIKERTFADVVYRSGNCDPRREAMVAIIRRTVEAAGFTFAATGYCGGEGYPRTPNWSGRAGWNECFLGCLDAKIMIAFERFSTNHDYLSEKLFVPLEHGAIPAYHGNGHTLLNMLTVNPKCYLDRNKFRSDQAYADYIVHLLRNPDELQKMQEEPVFLNPDFAEKRIFYFSDPEKYGREGAPELFDIVRSHPRLKPLIGRSEVVVRRSSYATIYDTKGLRVALNVTRFREARLFECAEIEYEGCCR